MPSWFQELADEGEDCSLAAGVVFRFRDGGGPIFYNASPKGGPTAQSPAGIGFMGDVGQMGYYRKVYIFLSLDWISVFSL